MESFSALLTIHLIHRYYVLNCTYDIRRLYSKRILIWCRWI